MARTKPQAAAGPIPGNTRSRRVTRAQLTPIQKRREKALIDAGISKDDIATEVRRRFGTKTRRQQVFAVFRDDYRSIDLIEPVAAELLGVEVGFLFPEDPGTVTEDPQVPDAPVAPGAPDAQTPVRSPGT